MKCNICNTADSPFMMIKPVSEKYKPLLKKYNYTEEKNSYTEENYSYIELNRLEQIIQLRLDLNESIHLIPCEDEIYIEIRDD